MLFALLTYAICNNTKTYENCEANKMCYWNETSDTCNLALDIGHNKTCVGMLTPLNCANMSFCEWDNKTNICDVKLKSNSPTEILKSAYMWASGVILCLCCMACLAGHEDGR